jgi:arylsulfatase
MKEERGGELYQGHDWVLVPAMKIVTEFKESMKKYPPIELGTPDPYSPPK